MQFPKEAISALDIDSELLELDSQGDSLCWNMLDHNSQTNSSKFLLSLSLSLCAYTDMIVICNRKYGSNTKVHHILIRSVYKLSLLRKGKHLQHTKE